MTSNLSSAAIEQLRILATKGAMQTPQVDEIHPLWNRRLAIGSENKEHVAVAEQAFARTFNAH